MSLNSKINSNLSDIERKLTKANAIVEKGAKLKVTDAIKLGAKSNAIVKTINKGSKDYQAFEPSEAEAKAIMEKMETIVKLTETQLTLLVQNKARFEELHVGGLVKKNMDKSDQASQELANIMLAKAPASLKPQAESLNSRTVAAFKKGKTAFEGSTGGEENAEAADDSD